MKTRTMFGCPCATDAPGSARTGTALSNAGASGSIDLSRWFPTINHDGEAGLR